MRRTVFIEVWGKVVDSFVIDANDDAELRSKIDDIIRGKVWVDFGECKDAPDCVECEVIAYYENTENEIGKYRIVGEDWTEIIEKGIERAIGDLLIYWD